jgi:peptide-methionine (S)-S-oxide reductase
MAMRTKVFWVDIIGSMALLLALTLSLGLGQAQKPVPSPANDSKPAAAAEQTAVLAGGCFWGVEAVFERLDGVKDVVSGFAGGSRAASYEVVTTGTTGHAEVVKITYDPAKISYGTLLKVFFAVAHDPTQLNRQGPDEGPMYRSSIFYSDEEQKRLAEAYIRQLDAAGVFPRRIVTTVVALDKFYPAGGEHQNFVARNPSNPYVAHNDLPKLAHLEKEFPQLLKPRR